MKEKKEKDNKKKSRLNGEKKFYLFSAIGCAATLVAIIVVALVVSNIGKSTTPAANLTPTTSDAPADLPQEPDEDEPVVTVPEGMIAPLETVAVLNDYGFYHNKTLNSYYEHAGIDFTAAAGTAVKAVESGVVESIYKDDLLLGTEIVVDHGDGLKTLYRFVTAAANLKVGQKVEKGEVIATVAEASGNEYKDGTHLHFEIMQNGKAIDPALRLPLEEK